MDILGIGPLELLFILLIILIVLGPTDMVKAGRTIGRFLRRVITSSEWQSLQRTSRDLRYLPNLLMREAGLEDLDDGLREIREMIPTKQVTNLDLNPDPHPQEIKRWQADLSDWTTPPIIDTPPIPLGQSEPGQIPPQDLPNDHPTPSQNDLDESGS